MDQWFNNLQNSIKNVSKVDEYEEIFWKSADDLLSNYHIKCGKDSFNIVEIEFYYYDKKLHPDCNTHCHQMQLNELHWYLHRGSNGCIKNGNRKGIDITIGNEVDVYGGVLIRAIQDSKGNVIAGPSLSVDAIMRVLNIQTVQILESNIGNMKINQSPLEIVKRESANSFYVYRGPRIRLSGNKPFKDSLYRFALMQGTIVNKEKLAKIAICKDKRAMEDVAKDLYKMKIDCSDKA